MSLLSQAVGLFAIILPLIGFAIMAWKTKYPVFFELCFALSFVAAFRWYDVFGTTDALAVSLVLMVFAIVCAGAAFNAMFNAPREGKG